MKSRSDFEKLPKDTILLIAIDLNFPEILNLCETSSKLNNAICKNEYFWINKLKKDFNIKFDSNKYSSPKRYYEFVYQFLNNSQSESSMFFKENILNKSQSDSSVKPKDLKNTKDMDDLLILAAKACNLDILKYAFENGGQLKNENEAVRMASTFGCLDVVKYFIENEDFDDAFKLRLLKVASENNHLHVVKYLVENVGVNPEGNNNMALRMAIQDNLPRIVNYLLDKGVNINELEDPFTPLSIAAYFGHLNILKLLIQRGADINAKYGIALLSAIHQKRLDIIKYLVEHGAATTLIGYINGIPQNIILLKAIKTGDYDIVKYLVDHGSEKTIGSMGTSLIKGNFKIAWLLRK